MATSAQLRALRRKYKLGEFRPKKGRKRTQAKSAPAKRKIIRRRKYAPLNPYRLL